MFDDMNVIEVIDGNMYLTSLYNFVQPLIRYKITDNLALQKPQSNSTYPFTKAVGLLGRSEDILWFTDESGNSEFLHPLAIEGFCIEGLLDYQFIQTGINCFEMLAETAYNASREKIRKEMLYQMNGILKEKNLSYVDFYMLFVDEISPDPQTGKKRLIASSAENTRVAV